MMADRAHPDAAAIEFLAPPDSAGGAAAVRGPPEVVLHSPVAAQRRAPPPLIYAAASLDYAGAPVGRQVLKHQSQPPPQVQVVFHRVRHLLVQQQRMVQRRVPEVDGVTGRVGWKVKRGARHGFLSDRSRGCPAIIQNDRAVGSSPVSILLAGDSEQRDSPALMFHWDVGTPGPIV